MNRIIIFLFFIWGFSSASYSQENKALKILLASSQLKHASVGIKVVDLNSGKIICKHNEYTSLIPASTLKILTTASALEILGTDFIYKTVLFTDGQVVDSVLSGNIYIKGDGDPTLGSSYLDEEKEKFLEKWVDDIKEKGIKEIDGSIIAIDDLYGYEGISNKWIWEDLGNYYASGTYGISVFDNTYSLYLKSGLKGTKPSILRTEPYIEGLKFENHLIASSKKSDSTYILGIPFSNERRLFGSIPANRAAFMIKGDIPDPGFFLATYFTSYLNKKGIKVSKTPSSARLMEIDKREGEVLSETSSSPLSDIIKITNFRSNNHFAQHLFYTMGIKGTNYYSHIPANSAGNINNYWEKKGIATGGLVLYDGSGLSANNVVSVDFLTEILIYMYKKSQYKSEFLQSLPQAGKEGTVRYFLKNTILEGKAQIKSGSISGVQSYAGYIEKNGNKYAFSIIINNYTGTRASLRSQLQTFLLNF